MEEQRLADIAGMPENGLNALKDAGYEFAGAVMEFSEEDFQKIHGIGESTAKKIFAVLHGEARRPEKEIGIDDVTDEHYVVIGRKAIGKVVFEGHKIGKIAPPGGGEAVYAPIPGSRVFALAFPARDPDRRMPMPAYPYRAILSPQIAADNGMTVPQALAIILKHDDCILNPKDPLVKVLAITKDKKEAAEIAGALRMANVDITPGGRGSGSV